MAYPVFRGTAIPVSVVTRSRQSMAQDRTCEERPPSFADVAARTGQ